MTDAAMSDGQFGSNPYVGPRPFEREDSDRFFGRRRDGRRLRNKVLSHSVVLFYAQSGCGKTSLLNAYLLPEMEEEGFRILPVARVRRVLPQGVEIEEVENIYAFNTRCYWNASDNVEATEAATLLQGMREQMPTRDDDEELPCLIVLDQFEELFTSYPGCWEQREDFFSQLDDILVAYPTTRMVLSIREDYLAHLDPYTKGLAGGNWSRVRLEALGRDQAVEAITKPLGGTGRRFASGVAERLVEDLAAVQTRDEHGRTKTIVGQFVEPVQLQVICQNLWESIGADLEEIGEQHLGAFGDVDQALRVFYENAISRACRDPDLHGVLRSWVETQLITSADTRGMVMEGATESSEVSDDVLMELLDTHLIRGEWRHGARWFELTHDRFIRPIQESNLAFREQFQQERAETAELKAENARRLGESNAALLGFSFGLPFMSGLMQVDLSTWMPNWVLILPAGIVALIMGVGMATCWQYFSAWLGHVSKLRSAIQCVAVIICLTAIASLWYSPHRWSIVVAGLSAIYFYYIEGGEKDDFPLDEFSESGERCSAKTKSGKRCKNKALANAEFCGVHSKLKEG